MAFLHPLGNDGLPSIGHTQTGAREGVGGGDTAAEAALRVVVAREAAKETATRGVVVRADVDKEVVRMAGGARPAGAKVVVKRVVAVKVMEARVVGARKVAKAGAERATVRLAVGRVVGMTADRVEVMVVRETKGRRREDETGSSAAKAFEANAAVGTRVARVAAVVP